jgi:hypothetical protein
MFIQDFVKKMDKNIPPDVRFASLIAVKPLKKCLMFNRKYAKIKGKF